MNRGIFTAVKLLPLLALLLSSLAFAQVELRITWYNDGNEGEVLRDLLDRFEADNPDIKVVVDTVPYSSGILETLPVQLAAGEGPLRPATGRLVGRVKSWHAKHASARIPQRRSVTIAGPCLSLTQLSWDNGVCRRWRETRLGCCSQRV